MRGCWFYRCKKDDQFSKMTIVPTNQTIYWVGIIFLPFAALAAAFAEAVAAAVGMAAGCTLMILFDAVRVRGRLSGIEIRLPEVVRLTRGRDGEISMQVLNEPTRAGRIRMGVPFPKEIQISFPDLTVILPDDAAEVRLALACKPLKQGRYYLKRCFLEIHSPLGFWALRQSRDIQVEIRVYPNLLQEGRGMVGLLLKKGAGLHPQRQVGKGRDFEQLREYIPGDGFEDIHWKATAKRGQPITKVYQIERTQEIYVIIDGSRLSARGAERSSASAPTAVNAAESLKTTIIERYAAAALAVGLAAQRKGDLFGIATFDDMVRSFVRAKNGTAHYGACRDELYMLTPQGVSPDFVEVFTFIATYLRRRALLIFLTSLDDPVLAENFSRHIDLISRRHLVLVNMLRPPNADPLFNSASITAVDQIYQQLGGHMIWQSLLETERSLKRHGVGFSFLDNENLCADLISQYLNVKKRQLL